MKVRDMSNEEARYAIFSAIEMGKTINVGEYPYHSVLVCAEMALDKQIAKKPKKIEVEGYRYTDTYKCPTCEGIFSGTGIADYCYHCGQKLDWGEED